MPPFSSLSGAHCSSFAHGAYTVCSYAHLAVLRPHDVLRFDQMSSLLECFYSAEQQGWVIHCDPGTGRFALSWTSNNRGECTGYDECDCDDGEGWPPLCSGCGSDGGSCGLCDGPLKPWPAFPSTECQRLLGPHSRPVYEGDSLTCNCAAGYAKKCFSDGTMNDCRCIQAPVPAGD